MSSHAANTQLEVLVTSASSAGYSLPESLTEAYNTLQSVKALTIPTPPTLDPATAAARVVTTTAAGEPVDVVALAAELGEVQLGRQRHDQARFVLTLAVEQASDRAQNLANGIAEEVIAQHLRPALKELHEQVRDVAAVLAGHPLDAHNLLSAPAKVRASYLRLPELLARRAAIFKARRLINTLGHREPKHDGAHLYGEFERPLALSPQWKPPMSIPPLPAPADPTARLLWVVSEQAAPARPWLPTIAEQDAAWLAQFGPEARARGHEPTRALA